MTDRKPSNLFILIFSDDLTDKKETDSKDDLNQQNYNDHLVFF